MPSSLFSTGYRHLVEVLKTARHDAGLTQAQLADRLGREQNWISLIESGQRRVDVLEFYALARALEADPIALFAEVANRLPSRMRL